MLPVEVITDLIGDQADLVTATKLANLSLAGNNLTRILDRQRAAASQQVQVAHAKSTYLDIFAASMTDSAKYAVALTAYRAMMPQADFLYPAALVKIGLDLLDASVVKAGLLADLHNKQVSSQLYYDIYQAALADAIFAKRLLTVLRPIPPYRWLCRVLDPKDLFQQVLLQRNLGLLSAADFHRVDLYIILIQLQADWAWPQLAQRFWPGWASRSGSGALPINLSNLMWLLTDSTALEKPHSSALVALTWRLQDRNDLDGLQILTQFELLDPDAYCATFLTRGDRANFLLHSDNLPELGFELDQKRQVYLASQRHLISTVPSVNFRSIVATYWGPVEDIAGTRANYARDLILVAQASPIRVILLILRDYQEFLRRFGVYGEILIRLATQIRDLPRQPATDLTTIMADFVLTDGDIAAVRASDYYDPAELGNLLPWYQPGPNDDTTQLYQLTELCWHSGNINPYWYLMAIRYGWLTETLALTSLSQAWDNLLPQQPGLVEAVAAAWVRKNYPAKLPEIMLAEATSSGVSLANNLRWFYNLVEI